MWTRFMDMHSGGGQKEAFDRIYIEADTDEAISVFYSRFGHSPTRVTCTCCGEDYSITTESTLEQCTAHDRNAQYAYPSDIPVDDWKKRDLAGIYVDPNNIPDGYTADRWKPYGAYMTVEEYFAKPDIFMITADEIQEHELRVEVPTEGYVWM